MKQTIFILTILIFISCGQTEKQKDESQIDKRAIELNKKGIELAMTFDNDSIKKAIELFDRATKIESEYYLAYWNKLVNQNQLGQKNEAFETLKKLEELRPNNPDLKVTAGIFLALNGDSLSARQKFLEADKIYTSIIDTLTQKTDPYQTTLTNKAVNLKLLGQEAKANKILKAVKTEMTDDNLKEMIESYITMTRTELLENFKTGK